MYYTADSIAEETSLHMAESNKGFESSNFGNEFYDNMDSEVSYQELFSSAHDQAVVSKPDFMTLNTPPVTAASFHPLENLSYIPASISQAITTTSSNSYRPLEPVSNYYSSASSTYSQSPAPSTHHLNSVPAIPEHVFNNRGPIIVPSATAPAEPKPRRKGGRKPKNDPLPPHLEERRRLRRIRNKDAAQKCRERRLAQTDDLLQQIESLERQTRNYEEIINGMREMKDQCEFILHSHKNNCNKVSKRLVSGLTLNTYNNTTCSGAHRRSSSSEGEISSPTFIM